MSHTIPSQHPAVVLRSNYQHLRALLAMAVAVILGLTVAVVVLATSSNHVPLASPTTQSATPANHSAETGAKLDHSGRNATVTQTTDRLANYPDAPPPSASTPQPSVSYYLHAPQH
jgi:type IV secretory pathway VirB10-like protein